MDGCRDSKPEGSEGNSQRDVPCCSTRRVTQPKAFVPNVSRIRRGADQPCRQPPHTHVSGGPGEHDADESVHDADENHDTSPLLPTCFVHVYGLVSFSQPCITKTRSLTKTTTYFDQKRFVCFVPSRLRDEQA